MSQARNSPQFMETEGLLPSKEETATGPSPELNESSPQHLALFL